MDASLVQSRSVDLTKPVGRRVRFAVTIVILISGAAAGFLWARSLSRRSAAAGPGGLHDGRTVTFTTGGFEGWIEPGTGTRVGRDGNAATLVFADPAGDVTASLRFLPGGESAGTLLGAWAVNAVRAGGETVMRRSRRIGISGRHRAEEAVIREAGSPARLHHRLLVSAPGGLLSIDYVIRPGGPPAAEDRVERAVATLDWK